MQSYIIVLLMLTLAYMAWQDFADRAVEWFWFPVLWLLLLANEHAMTLFFFDYALINTCFVVVFLTLLHVYLLCKYNERLSNDKHLGFGDMLFFMVVTMAFSPVNFVGFIVASELIVILASRLVFWLQQKEHTIPLVGGQAWAMMLVLVWCANTEGINRFNDNQLLKLIYHAYLAIP